MMKPFRQKVFPFIVSLVLMLLPAASGLMNTMSQTQNVVISGVVLDTGRNPVIGAVVMQKGHPERGASITDIDGNYSITVAKGATILISCLGYSDKELVVSDSSIGKVIILEEEAHRLDDVVVVAYGTQRKESVVGSIAQVRGDALVNSGYSGITNALTGKMSGVSTMQTSGQPGSNDASILIRGMSSWNGNEPLVMVDGVERSFSELDPEEIKTISVLKDASATAMFGAKGANGVILVTTKTGELSKPRMNLTANFGIDIPRGIPKHISSYETALAMNTALKNVQSYGSIFSEQELAEYKNPSSRINTLRYPDINWFDETMKPFANNAKVNFGITGGTEIVKYYIGVGYDHEGSIFKNLSINGNNNFNFDKLNYRTNLDIEVTKSTSLSVKLGGFTGIQRYPTATETMTEFMQEVFGSSPMMYVPYYPAWALEAIPDTEYPDAEGLRIGTNKAYHTSYVANPYAHLARGDYEVLTKVGANIDLGLTQKLDYLTEGLSLSAKVSYTGRMGRISEKASGHYNTYYIDWDRVDLQDSNPWKASASSSSINVIEQIPYSARQGSVTSYNYTFYWEGAVNYSRRFGNHTLGALALFSQRDYKTGTQFAYRYESLVSRVTYDYAHKYLVEANVGYTGSEQFAPANRFGLFPSVAVGYVPSEEKWWKAYLPWWNKFKLRFSHGLVGSDSASERWLYYTTYTKSDGYIYEGSTGNDTARWETARKSDLGIEFGFLNNDLTFNVDLFDEYRYGMLITPVTTMLLATEIKDINKGSMKKHGIELEAAYSHSFANGFSYNLGAMLSLNENRILVYNDAPYTPDYQRFAGTLFGGQKNGTTLVDSGYLTSIDDIHNYPLYSQDWNQMVVGAYKYLDFNVDKELNSQDLHRIKGSVYPPAIYSFNGGFRYKGLEFNMMFYGTIGKYVVYDRYYEVEFTKGDWKISSSQLDAWAPDNRDANHAALVYDASLGHAMYTWAGGNSNDAFTARIPGRTWRKSDYLMLKDLYLGYNFDMRNSRSGISSLCVYVTGNNLFTITDLIEGDPQATSLVHGYYPMMATIKLGFKIGF